MGIAHFSQLGARVDAVMALTRRDCDDMALADQVRAADLIYFSGGKPDYLYRTLVDTLVWGAVKSVLDRGGVVAGCSAGAMVMGGHVPAFSGSEGTPEVDGWLPGFGLLPDALIVPHYNEIPDDMLASILGDDAPGSLLIGLDADTALVGWGDRWTVMGAGRVTLRRGGQARRYTAGEAVSVRSQG
jgi:cyanophycinase